MGIFASTTRKSNPSRASRVVASTESVGHGLRARFEAVSEHLEGSRAADAACAEVGRQLARDSADLGEALDGLRSTYAHVLGVEPGFAALRAMCVAWGEETLGQVRQVSCEDPLTGLATQGHLLSRIEEIYRGAEQHDASASKSHALVVVGQAASAPRASPADSGGNSGGNSGGPFGHALGLALQGSTIRSVFPGEESIGRVGHDRLVAVVRRDEVLARRVALLRQLLGRPAPDTGGVRVWIEGLPGGFAAAVQLLDELSRPWTPEVVGPRH